MTQEIEKLKAELVVAQCRIDELEGRINKALKAMGSDLRYVQNDYRGNFEYLRLAMIRTIQDNMRYLKGK